MRTWRVMCPLLSQKVTLLARMGSSGAGCTLPSASNALDVTMCWPVAGIPQPNVQNLHAKPRLFWLWRDRPEEPRRHPRSVVDADFHRRDRRTPGGAKDDVAVVSTYDFCWGRLEAIVPHGAECPERLAVALLLADGHVVSRHEVPRMALVAYLDARQPLDVGHAIPTRSDQADGKPFFSGRGSPFIS